MATKQGMCRNCGSLVVFDDRDDMCECIFCNCVFPAEEAIALLENHEGHEFKNEKFEAKEGGKHYYSNPVMPDTVQKAVQRELVIVSMMQIYNKEKKPRSFFQESCGVLMIFRNSLMIGIYISQLFVAGILSPTRIQVKHLLLDGEDTVALVEVGIGEVRVVGEELILEVSEANHIVATPVLVEELAATLLVDFLKRRLCSNLRSAGIGTNLVEEILCTALSQTGEGLSLHKKDIGEAEERQVV